MSMKHTQPVRRHALPNFVLLMLLAWVVSGCATPATAPNTSASEATPVIAESTTESTTESTAEAEVSLFPLTITDAVGQEFTFDAPPKIGCDWYGCHEAMADLGIAPTAAGMGVEESTSVFYAPAGPPATLIEDAANPESWAAAGVDLIVTRVPATAENDVLTAAAPIFYLHHPSYGESDQQGYQAYYENLRLLVQLTGQPEAADAAIARFENFLANLRRLATPETAALTVAVLFGGDSYSGLSRENPFCTVLAEVGLGQCPGPEDPEEFWPEVNAEQFLAIDPDWIVYEGFGASYTERTDPVWGQLTAVKEGRVYDAATGGRSYCCSTRGLIHSLQDYVSHILPDAGIPSPGPHLDFDPLTSPLVAAPEGTS